MLSVEEYFKDKEALLKEHEAVFPLKPAPEGSKPHGKGLKGKKHEPEGGEDKVADDNAEPASASAVDSENENGVSKE